MLNYCPKWKEYSLSCSLTHVRATPGGLSGDEACNFTVYLEPV